MRSPVLAFSLFAAAATVTAQGLLTTPRVTANVGTYQAQVPRGYSPGAYSPEDRADGRREAARAGRPQPPRLSANHGNPLIPTGGGLNGGVSDTAPATGADAGDGGRSASSNDSDPASGTDIFHLGSSIQDTIGEGAQVPQSTGAGGAQDDMSAQQADAPYKPPPGYSYNPQRMRRVAPRLEPAHNVSRRADYLGDLDIPNENIPNNNGSDENSNNDGPDGVSQRGSETDGEGPNGGKAHSGQVGSSKGGHVYNMPASSE